MMYGIFHDGKNPPVTRQRLRDSLNRVRLVRNIPPLQFTPIRRRQYSVKAPLSMIHIDGHHKLIRLLAKLKLSDYVFHNAFFWRYGIVIHGAIDGYSRCVIFLEVSLDNRAATVLSYFKTAVMQYGLPVGVRYIAISRWNFFFLILSQIRTDHGTENVSVADFMLAAREFQENGSPFITGRSIHNQRIERLWRDVFQCLQPFHALFQ